MTLIAWVLLAYCAVATLLHLATTLLVLRRCTRSRTRDMVVDGAPGVTIIRPVCGLDAIERTTLASTFKLETLNVEVLFCCASPSDPVVPYLRRLIADNPGVGAQILLGDDLGTANPKLNNIAKGWRAGSNEWVIWADSNLLLPPDYVGRALSGWKVGTGLVCAPPIGSQTAGFWAEVECAFLNTYQARWQYAADCVGFGFAQGKTMLWRRTDLDRLGGIAALGGELAEDAAATKLVRAAGRKVRLADPSFHQPLGWRSAAQVLSRQARWAQLRRMSFPYYFALELLTGCLLPILAGATAVCALGGSLIVAAVGLLALWLGAEAVLAWGARWHLGWRSPLAWLLRDLLIPVIWTRGLIDRTYGWRGNKVTVRSVDGGITMTAREAFGS